MRVLAKTESSPVYKLYMGIEPIYDENGWECGERAVYSEPIVLKNASVSAAKYNVDWQSKGAVKEELYGNFNNYDISIIVCRTGLGIDENTLFSLDGKEYSYIVQRCIESQNITAMALSKVNRK